MLINPDGILVFSRRDPNNLGQSGDPRPNPDGIQFFPVGILSKRFIPVGSRQDLGGGILGGIFSRQDLGGGILGGIFSRRGSCSSDFS